MAGYAEGGQQRRESDERLAMEHKHEWGDWKLVEGPGYLWYRVCGCGKKQTSRNLMWGRRAGKWVRAR